jgi:hypothetical protein
LPIVETTKLKNCRVCFGVYDGRGLRKKRRKEKRKGGGIEDFGRG